MTNYINAKISRYFAYILWVHKLDYTKYDIMY